MLSALRNISYRLLWYLNLFTAFLLIICYFSPFISPKTFSWTAILALGYPFLLLFNIGWVIFWLYNKSRAVYLSLGTILIGCAYIPTLFGFGGGKDPGKDGIRIMSYNVRYFNTTIYTKEENQLKSQDKILDYISKQNPDILCSQEFSGKGRVSSERADNILRGKGLGYVHRGGISSLAILSRYPLENKGTIHFQGSSNGAIHADALIEGKKIRIYAVHLQSVRLGKYTDEVLKKDNLSTLNKKETQEKYYKIEEKLSNAFEMRAIQAKLLSEHIAASPYPVIICGDFNDTPLSYSYRLMSQNMKDSFVEKGWGLGTTYAGVLPALRIDYILVSNHFDVYKHQIQKSAISDHYAIHSDVRLN